MRRATSSSSIDISAGEEIELWGDSAITVDREEQESQLEPKPGVPRMEGEDGASGMSGEET
jgi:hypothetical protein